jgi:hypothetical protein
MQPIYWLKNDPTLLVLLLKIERVLSSRLKPKISKSLASEEELFETAFHLLRIL